MSIQINSAHDIRVEYRGHFYAEDELRESIWQIAEMEAALKALVTAEGAGR